jgi:transketolase
MTRLYDCRDAFEDTLRELASLDSRIVAVVNDSVGSSKLTQFGNEYPNRLVNVGIAEQNMVGVGAGLANGGLIPFVCGAAPFLTGRALEQIKADIAYSNANVKLCGMSSGMAYGELGPTHHSIEDMAWLRAIANMTVIVPADPVETVQAVQMAASTIGPMFLRISRLPVPIVHEADYRFEVGKAALLRDGRDITLIANGVLVTRALEAADLLAARGIQARVLNMSTARPLDREAVRVAASGGAVAEVVVTNCPVPMRILGVPGVFAPTGSASWLLQYFNLTAQGIYDAALELMEVKVI